MSARRLPPLMADNPRAVQIAFVIGAPVVFGAITGVFLGLSETVYAVLSIIGALGGVVPASTIWVHARARDAACSRVRCSARRS